MQILGLLGMYLDAVVVFVTNSSLFFRLALAILWMSSNCAIHNTYLLTYVQCKEVSWGRNQKNEAR